MPVSIQLNGTSNTLVHKMSNGISTANNGTSSTYNSIHLINNYVLHY